MSRLAIAKRRDGPGWLVMNPITTATVPTFESAIDLVRTIERATMQDFITVTVRASQLERVLELAHHDVHTSPELETVITDLDAVTTVRERLDDARLAL